jgi:hypothetical protein
MNALGNSLFHDLVNQTLKITTISTMRTNHLRGIPKTVLLDENREHTLSCRHRFRFGPLANVHYTIQIHPSWRLQVNGIPSGQAGRCGGWVPWVEGDRPLLHMGQAGHSSTIHWLLWHSTLNTTAHLTDRTGLLTSNFSPVGHRYKETNLKTKSTANSFI